MMNKNSDINVIILYYLASYEKGRLCTTKSMSLFEKKRLKKSVNMMLIMLSSLEYGTANAKQINKFIHKNKYKIFSDNIYWCDTNPEIGISGKQRDVFSLMKSILYDLKYMLSKFMVKKYELKKIKNYLYALHNLPRALLSSSSKEHLMCSDALKYAYDWLLK